MSAYVGINVVEVDGPASPTIVPAPTSVAGFVGVTERGPLNTPIRVTDPGEFEAHFGGHIANGYLAYAIAGFFLNGGREAHVCRVAGSAGSPAGVNLNDREGAPTATLRLEGGSRGHADPGIWARDLRIDVRDDPRATTTAAAAAGANATSVRLASTTGVSVGSVILFADTAAAAQQRKITSIDTDGTVHWSGAVVAGIANGAQVTTAEFRIVVRTRPAPTAPLAVVETWPNLSMEADSADYVVDQLNDALAGSLYLRAIDQSGTVGSGLENPAVASNVALTGGSDAAPAAADFVGDEAAQTGLHAFDGNQIELLSLPDVHRLAAAADKQIVVQGALDYCAGRGDVTFIGSAPDRAHAGATVARSRAAYTAPESAYVGVIEAFSTQFQAEKVYGALYTPWIRVLDPVAAGSTATQFIPPDGHVLGVYARSDLERGIWKTPAGIGAIVRGALDVAADFSDAQHDDLVRNGYVNGIRFAPGIGITIAASRTLSSDPRWWFVNSRLLFNFVKSSLRDGLRFVRQQPNSGDLRNTVKFNVVTPFLLGLWRRGAFGSDPANKVFTVVCDASNNPPSEVDLGNFHLDVTFYPVRPAETVVINVGQQPSGGSASES